MCEITRNTCPPMLPLQYDWKKSQYTSRKFTPLLRLDSSLETLQREHGSTLVNHMSWLLYESRTKHNFDNDYPCHQQRRRWYHGIWRLRVLHATAPMHPRSCRLLGLLRHEQLGRRDCMPYYWKIRRITRIIPFETLRVRMHVRVCVSVRVSVSLRVSA